MQFTQWKSETPRAEDRQTAFRFLVHFLCKNRSSIRTKNLPPHWEWQQQHSCCSRERTEQGRLSGVVTATSATRDTSKVTPLPENENSLQWYSVYNFKFNSLIILIRQLPYQENMSETKRCSTEYICWNWSYQHRDLVCLLLADSTATAGAIPIWCERMPNQHNWEDGLWSDTTSHLQLVQIKRRSTMFISFFKKYINFLFQLWMSHPWKYSRPMGLEQIGLVEGWN